MAKKTFVKVEGPKHVKSVLAPLFDRLTAEGDATLSLHGLKASIEKELSFLFNTRSPYATTDVLALLETKPLPPTAYGIPDLDAFNISSKSTWGAVGGLLSDLVRIYEPRLHGATVDVIGYDPPTQKILLTISGTVTLENRTEAVHFSLSLDR